MTTTILLVEDNRIQRLVNERILHKAGYNVLYAADGEEALRLARQSIPDIILLDMLLPKLGGREVMQALRQYFIHRADPGARVQRAASIQRGEAEKGRSRRLLPEITIDGKRRRRSRTWWG